MIALIYDGHIERNNGVSIEKDFITGNRFISPITHRQLLAFLSQFEHGIKIKINPAKDFEIEVLNALPKHK